MTLSQPLDIPLQRSFSTSNKPLSFSVFIGLLCSALLFLSTQVNAAPSKKLDPRWIPHSLEETLTINHAPWQVFLDNYLIFDDKEQTYMAYGKVTPEHSLALAAYIDYLSNLAPKALTKTQQMAYWINLYNAKTVALILENYPLESITKLGKTWFKFGPWDDKILKVEGIKLSLNDIEHRILRPIFEQSNLHYALNCASLSCPNLGATAYTSENAQILLTESARNYINHSRGVHFNDEGELVLSSIYKWYKDDFGVTYRDLITHLFGYANKELGEKLRAYKGPINYEYDWGLNEIN